MTSHGRADTDNATLAAHSVIIHRLRRQQTLMGSRDCQRAWTFSSPTVNRIAELAGYDHVYKLGDGHGEMTSSASPSRLPPALTLAQAKAVVGATNVGSDVYPYTGREITVGLIGTGTDFTHPDLQNKNAASLLCTQLQCINASLLAGTNRATSTSAVIASNSTNPAMAGMAPDSMIHDARLAGVTHVGESSVAKNTFARALDEMMTSDITVALSILANTESYGCNDYSALTIVTDRAVHEGLSFSMAIGNKPDNTAAFPPPHIQKLACGFNYISAGAVDKDRILWSDSVPGPAQFNTPGGDSPRIKPEITAIGVDLDLARAADRRNMINRDYEIDSGTSFATAFVAGASALILEKQPDYRHLEIKSALLLGADWQADTPATAADYDNRRAGIYDTMNRYGFGILNATRSLDYANDNQYPNVLYDQSSGDFDANSYRIYAGAGEQVKVLLSWLVHPRGTVLSPTLPIGSPHIQLPSQYHNYDLAVTFPNGVTRTSDSDVQNNEFVVFDAPETGFYTITVSSDGTLTTAIGEPYTLASTHGIDKFPYDLVVPVTEFADDFESDLSKWDLSGDSDWEIGDPDEDVPGENSRTNQALISSNCDTDCIATTSSTFDTQDALTVSFDRFVDSSVDAGEGLFVEYSADGTNWINLASYTHNNREDSGSWSSESLSLDITEDTAKIRFVAKSSSSSEHVEIDNVAVMESDGGGPSDTTDPVITAPADVTAEATGVLTAVSIGQATAIDNLDPDPAITNDAPESFPIGDTTVTWTATDDFGNTATATQTVTIQDTTPPWITAPADRTAEATGVLTVTSIGQATAIDIADPDPTITNDAPASFSLGDTVITWTATDDSGNAATATQTVTVQDTTPPSITAPADHTAEATGVLTTISIGQATATDNLDPDPVITHDAPESFPLGDTIVTWTATDDFGNMATVTQTVTIQDTTLPSITAPLDVTTEASGVLTVTSIGQATATDNLDPDPAITNDAPESFPLGSTTVTWTATDDSGNAATDTQTVTIQDTTLPSITAPPDVTTEASGVLSIISIGQATATDTADPDPAITNDAPESFPLGDTIVTWTATDSSDNAATATQTVTIQDTTPPSITAPADHTAEAAGIMTILNAGDYGTPTVSDIADPSPTITNDAPESFPLGNTTVTWTAADSSGNEATAAQTVTIQDTTPPAISGLRNISVDDPAGRGMEVSYDAPTATDLVDGAVAVSCTHESGSTFAPGFTEVSCMATDGSANSLRDWFIIHVDASDAILDVSQTVSTGRSTWSVTGPDRIFAGQTFEYTVTLEDGARPREEALAVYSAAPDTRYLGWHDPDADCQTILCAGFPEQKHNTYKIASDEDSPYTAMHNKMKKSRSSHTILLQPAADAPAGAQATVGMLDASYNPVGGIPVTVMPPSTRTVTDGDTTWRITGPDRIFPGQTFEYTVTLDGTRHQHDALAIYSDSLTVDDFGGLADDSACGTTVCTDFPGQRRRTMELDNHAGSSYDVRYHTINAPGSQYTILLRIADDADAGGTFRVGLVDGDGSPMGGIRVTIADPVTVTAPYEELVAGLSFEGSLADITGDNNGTAAGGISYVEGRIGRGLQLDGSTNVTLAGEADFDFGRTDPFSIAFWLRQDAPVNGSTMIMSKAESFGHTGSYVWVWGGAPNRVLLSIHDNSTFINVHTPQHMNMSDGAWHHIAFTYDGSGAKEGLNAYIDGEHRDYDHFRRGQGLAGDTTNDHAFTVRTTSWGDPDRIDSVLDELRVYGAELSARQVRLLHAAGLG